LRSAAKSYNFPYGYFYLANPPGEHKFKKIPDYRIDPELTFVDHPRLHLEIKKARDRRGAFLEIVRSLDDATLEFQTLESVDLGSVGDLVRRRLGVSSDDLTNVAYEEVYSYWKSKIESDGVLVYESQYIPDETGVLGVAIFESDYPIILLKRGGNSNQRKLFTLLHEYAHLLLEESAINDASSQAVSQPSSEVAELESKCNRIAAEILIPRDKVSGLRLEAMSPEEKMVNVGQSFKVTYSTAAISLRRMGQITQEELQLLLQERREEYERKKAKTSRSGGVKIPREILNRLDMGRPMFDAVLTAYSRGRLDVFDASELLNLRVQKIDKLVAGTSR
jgi:Zn-dependent peptidase ImmA (M78 family)